MNTIEILNLAIVPYGFLDFGFGNFRYFYKALLIIFYILF